MISLDRALELVAREVRPLERTGIVDFRSAVGETLALGVVADIDMPPFDQARMDGYAVLDEDVTSLPAVLSVVGMQKAGDPPPAGSMAAGGTWKVMTGAPLPAGCERVVPVEDTEALAGGAQVKILRSSSAPHLTRRGSDFQAGQEVLRAGRTLRVADLAVLATVGHTRVTVRCPDRSAVLIAGGDELVAAHERVRPGQIRNSNGPTLARLLAALGLPVVQEVVAGDTRDAHAAAILAGLERADLVVTSGGVSMGDFDVVPDAIAAAGGTIHFDRVALQPGKPVTFATTASGKVILALPGNPCSAYVTCLLLGRAIIARLRGADESAQGARRSVCPLACAIPGPSPRRRFLPGRIAAGGARPVPWNGSADLLGFASGEVLLELPENEGPFAAGDPVSVIEMPG